MSYEATLCSPLVDILGRGLMLRPEADRAVNGAELFQQPFFWPTARGWFVLRERTFRPWNTKALSLEFIEV